MEKLKLMMISLLSLLVLTGCNTDPDIISPPSIPDYSNYMSLGEYKNLEYTVKNDYSVTDEMLNDELESICLIKASIESMPDKKIEKGDNILLMYSGTVDNKTFQNSSTNEQGILVKLGKTVEPVSLFEDSLIGMKKSESKKITVNIPADYSDKSIAGKTAEFSIYISDVIKFTFENPITDSMVAECSSDRYKSIADVKSTLLSNMKNLHDFEIYNAVMAEIIKKSTFTSYPEADINKLVQSAVKIAESNAASANLPIDEFLAKYDQTVKTLEDFKSEMTKQAQQYLQVQMTLCEIARAENIDITDEEFTEYKKKFAEENGYTDWRTVNMDYTDTELLMKYIEPKVREWLITNTNVSNRCSFE